MCAGIKKELILVQGNKRLNIRNTWTKKEKKPKNIAILSVRKSGKSHHQQRKRI